MRTTRIPAEGRSGRKRTDGDGRGPSPSRRIRALLLLAAFATGGCYGYRPAEGPFPQGTPVRIGVEPGRDVPLRSLTARDVVRVEGEVARWPSADAGPLSLSASWVESATGYGLPGEGWTVEVPLAAVRSVQVKEISWLRTAVLGITALTIGVVAFDAFELGGGGGSGDGPGGEPH